MYGQAFSLRGERLSLRGSKINRLRPFPRGSHVGVSSIEPLEERTFFSTYTVTSLADSAGVVTSTTGGNFQATTLRAAIASANAHSGADSIRFAANVHGKITLSTALPALAGPLTIAGPGASKLTLERSASTQAAFSVLHVDPAANVTISDLKLTGGNGDRSDGIAYGGGVLNLATLKLQNCVISGNVARPASFTVEDTYLAFGGGIYSEGPLTAIGCTFSNNTAYTGDGGAIESLDALTLTNCTFTNNSTPTGRGGALRAVNTVPATIANCTFTNNLADGYGGGGIYSEPAITISGSTFDSNVGTGLYVLSSIDADHCSFRNNVGGGIVSGDVSTLNDCSITNNHDLADGGGGIYAAAPITLIRCTIAGNTAIGHAGGLYAESDVNLNACTISNNSAGGHGGGTYVLGALIVSNSTFNGNSAGYGGAVLARGNSTFVNTTFFGNSAGDGAAIGFYAQSLRLTNCTITSNSCAIGAAVTTFGVLTMSNNILVGNVRFAGTSLTPSDLFVGNTGSVNRLSYANLIGTVVGPSTLGNGKYGNRVGVTADQTKLGPLASNGGPTQTIALLPGSIAINAGCSAMALAADGSALKTDQRGAGFARWMKTAVDVGSYEVQAAGSIAGVVYNDQNHNGKQDAGEKGVKGRLVWVDLDRDGQLDVGETQTTTDSAGRYVLDGVPAGQYLICVKPVGTSTASSIDAMVLADQFTTGFNFASR